MNEVPTRHLGDVASFVRGITFKPGDVVPVGSPGSVACMRTKNVQSELDLSDVWGIPESFVKRPDQYLLTEDLLVSSANSWNLVGKCCRVPQLQWPATFGGFISVLRGDPSQIETRYLYHWFSSPRIQATVRSFGQQTTNISNLNVDRCLRLWLPIPPLAEQKRIAGILDAADALRAKRREGLGQLDTLLQSTFLDMFGDPVTNPMGWEKRELSHLCRFLSGYAWKAKSFNSDRIGSPVIRIQNVGTESSELVHTIEEPIERFWVEQGEYLLSLSGSFRLATWNGPRALLNQRIVKLTPESILTPAYFGSELSTQLSAIEAMGRHALVNNVALSDLKKVELCLPPLDLQQRFAAIVESIEQQKTSQRAHLAELDTLFASLQARAFRGDL